MGTQTKIPLLLFRALRLKVNMCPFKSALNRITHNANGDGFNFIMRFSEAYKNSYAKNYEINQKSVHIFGLIS